MFNQFMFGPQSIPNANGPMLAEKPGMFSGILSKLNPFPAGLSAGEGNARAEALMMAGLGMLAGNQGNYGAALPAIAQGGMAGLQGYRNSLKEQAARRAQLLQEKLIGSQIAENDSQAAERTRKTAEAKRLQELRRKLIAEMDSDFVMPDSSQNNFLSDSTGVTPLLPTDKVAPSVNVRPNNTHWSATVEGNQQMATKLFNEGDVDGAKEYWNRAEKLADQQFKGQDLQLKFEAAKQGKYKERKRNIKGGMFVQEYSLDGGMTWQQIPDSAPASIRDAAGGSSVEVQAYEPASKRIQGESMKSLQDSYDKLANAPATIANLRAIKAQSAQLKNFSGSLADKKIAVAKFFNNNFGTNIKPEELASAEAINTRLFLPIMDNLKAMDSQPSQLQQQMMRDAFGNILTDPNALPMIADIMEQNIRQKVDIHNRKYKQASQRGITFPYDLNVDLPGNERKEVKKYRYQGKTVIEYDDGTAEMDGKPVKIK